MTNEKSALEVCDIVSNTTSHKSAIGAVDWDEYLASLSKVDHFAFDTPRIHQDLSKYGSRLFQSHTDLEIFETSDDSTSMVEPLICRTTLQVEAVLRRPVPKFRVISLLRQQSISNYGLLPDTLMRIMRCHAIQPSFADLLVGFRNPRPHAESGYGIWHASVGADRGFVVSYQFRYMELNHRNNGVKWSVRQIGVYHQMKPQDQGGNVMLLIHANHNCQVKQRFARQATSVVDSPLNVVPRRPFAGHTMVFSTYLNNWRWYLEDLGQMVEDIENEWLTIDLESVANEMNFSHLQQLRDIDSRLLTAKTVLETTRDTIIGIHENISALKALHSTASEASNTESDNENVETAQDDAAFSDMTQRCKSYIRSVVEVQRRNQRLIQLATDGINLSVQSVASRVNKSVRIVTVITLIYLPAQFVATFFGTNFVLFDPDTGLLRFAKDFWIFLVVSIPMTMITILLWIAVTKGYTLCLKPCWSASIFKCRRRLPEYV